MDQKFAYFFIFIKFKLLKKYICRIKIKDIYKKNIFIKFNKQIFNF